LAIAASLGLLVVGGRTEASVLIDISQVGSNVVAVGSGELDLIGLTFNLGVHVTPGVGPIYAVVGPIPVTRLTMSSLFRGLAYRAHLGRETQPVILSGTFVLHPVVPETPSE
jgi:hypothetical protein